MRPNPGDVVGGKYRIVRLIGDGGMGAVYEARHEVLGSPVALKFLHAELAVRPGLASRFLQEARVSASIQSAHVTRVTDVGQTPDGAPYLVMELLNGESLQQLLDRQHRVSHDQAVDFALQMLLGIEAAHALGVVHRDLKPDNVYITPSPGGPVLKLLDFGIAKLREAGEPQDRGLTRPGAIMGTPEYMAPEQLYAAERVDHRADIYSLGAITYELLSGSRPAEGDDAPEIIARVAQGQIRPLRSLDPTIPPGLAEVVHRALAADKHARFGSAMEMRLALAPFAGQLSHAGRLAATPAPAAATDPMAGARPPGPGKTPILGVEPAVLGPSGQLPARGLEPLLQGEPSPAEPPSLSLRGSNVPPTLPPEDHPDPRVVDPSHLVKGSTQEAPRGPLLPGVNPLKGSTQEAPRSAFQQPLDLGPERPGGRPYLPGHASLAFPPPPAARQRSGNRVLGAVVALLLGLVVTSLVVAGIALSRNSDQDEPPVLPLAFDEAVQDAGSEEPAGDAAIPLPPTTSPPVLPPRPRRPTVSPSQRDAGPPPVLGDGGLALPPLPPLPSTLPSLPSALPPLPSTFPSLPFPAAPTAQGTST